MLQNSRRKLTDALLDTFETQPTIAFIRDSQLSRFAVRVSRLHLTFVVQADRPRAAGGPRKTHQIRIGRFPYMRCAAARAKAVSILGAIDAGQEPALPGQIVAGAGTLQSAWNTYRDSIAKKVAAGTRSPATLSAYTDLFDRLLKSIHTEPLARLSANPMMVTKLHAAIADANGTSSADASARLISAIYRNAARHDPTLQRDRSPTAGVEFTATKSPDNAMSTDELPIWWAELMALSHPIRREFHVLSILTGLRRTDVATARWENVDLKRRTLFLPKPKGGVRRAFTIPLSRPALRALWRARRAARMLHPRQSTEWCFPSAKGPMGDTDEYVSGGGKALSRTGHGLRRTFRTQALVAGVPEEICERMMNHKSGTQSSDYVSDRALLAFYAAAMQKIATHLMTALIPEPAQRRGFL